MRLEIVVKLIAAFRVLTAVVAVAATLSATAQTVNVVEYRNKTLDAYFLTGRANEQAALDAVADFTRTGMSFQATAATTAPAALTRVCRFYVSVATPFVNSHFYGRQGVDCESILAANPAGFSYEGYDFALQTPTTGTCPSGTTPVYRSFRALAGNKTSNHRYTVSTATYAGAAAVGYVGEGAAFCASVVTDAAGAATATAVGVPLGAAASATVGAAGGSLSAPDGRLVLTIPPGALANNTAIGIQPITNFAHGKIGSAYRLTPDGQTFLKPATLTFGYTDNDVLGTAPEFLGAAFQTAAGFWQWLGVATVDTAAKTVSVNSSHFTDFSNVAGLQIRPAKKTVKPKATVALQVKVCYQVSSSDDELMSLATSCDVEQGIVPTLVIDEWSVNGRLGGGGVFGTVVGSGATATYTAPENAPTPPTVEVSARVHNPKKPASAKTLVVSLITIAEDSWTGTSTSTHAPANVSADIIWTLDRTVNNVSTYLPSGTVNVSGGIYDFCTVNPATWVIEPADGALVIDYNANPPTYFGGGTTSWAAGLTCPPAPGATPITVTGYYLGGNGGPSRTAAAGSVSGNGTIIEGTDTVSGNNVFKWKFTRNQ
jgi:hypothetical protein